MHTNKDSAGHEEQGPNIKKPAPFEPMPQKQHNYRGYRKRTG